MNEVENPSNLKVHPTKKRFTTIGVLFWVFLFFGFAPFPDAHSILIDSLRVLCIALTFVMGALWGMRRLKKWRDK